MDNWFNNIGCWRICRTTRPVSYTHLKNNSLIGLIDKRIVEQTKLVNLTSEEKKLKEKLAKVQSDQQKGTESKYVTQTKQAYQQLIES